MDTLQGRWSRDDIKHPPSQYQILPARDLIAYVFRDIFDITLNPKLYTLNPGNLVAHDAVTGRTRSISLRCGIEAGTASIIRKILNPNSTLGPDKRNVREQFRGE